jgi:hypothetical protein
MTVTRAYHSSTLISQDNSVIIAGGYNGGMHMSVEKYIPSTGCFQTMRDMPRARYVHTADQLPSLFGYVIIAGGYGVGGAIGFADFYHPITGNILTVTLSTPRYAHTSTILSSSQIAFIGGISSSSVLLNSGDMLNTRLNSSIVCINNNMTSAPAFHTATLLGNTSNVALIAGGFEGSSYLSSAILYHGLSNAFVPLSGTTMPSARAYHTATYLSPPIYKVLITGGRDSGTYFNTMLLFDVNTLTFTTLSSTMASPRHYHTATLLPNGKVLLVGGHTGVTALRTCEVVDPFNNYSVTFAANLTTNRYVHTATFIPDSGNGTILVCGGYNAVPVIIGTCELYFV